MYLLVIFYLSSILMGKLVMSKSRNKFVIFVGNETINLEKVRIRVHRSYDGQLFKKIIDAIFHNDEQPFHAYTFVLPKLIDKEERGMILIAEAVKNDIVINRASIYFGFPKKNPPNIEISYGDKHAIGEIGKTAYFSFTLFHGNPGYD